MPKEPLMGNRPQEHHTNPTTQTAEKKTIRRKRKRIKWEHEAEAKKSGTKQRQKRQNNNKKPNITHRDGDGNVKRTPAKQKQIMLQGKLSKTIKKRENKKRTKAGNQESSQ